MADLAREEALATLQDAHAGLGALLEGVPDEALVRTGTIGGGDWSAKDLIGHVGTWEEASVEAIEHVRLATVPPIEEYFRQEGGVDRYNALKVGELADLPLELVRERASATHARLTEEIRTMSDEEWFAKVPYEAERRRTLANLLGSITGAPKRPFGHGYAHLPDLEAFVRTLT